MSVELRGSPEQLARISRELKNAPRELQRELFKELNRATKPVKAAIRASAQSTLPHRGGLAADIARSRISTRRTVSSKAAGVRLVTSNKRGLRRLDKGVVRHPVYGNRDVWVNQPVTPGWWSKPIEAGARDAQKAVEEAVGRVSDRIERAGRGL